MDTNPRVIVANPGSHHLFQTAIGLEKAGLLVKYITSIYFKTNGFLERFIRILPPSFKNKALEQLKRRSYQELPPDHIKTFGAYEWLHLFATRFSLLQPLLRPLINKRNTSFSKNVGSFMGKTDANILWSGLDASLDAFKMLKKSKTILVLDQFIGHPRALNKALKEETIHFPELQNVIHDWIEDKRVQNMEREIALANHVVVGSEFAKQTLITEGVPASKIAVIPYGAHPRHIEKTARPKNELNILFVGNISVRKGCHYLLKAFQELNHPKLRLTMIGTLEDRYFMEKYGNYFTWIPHIPHHAISKYFSNADIYIQPSLFEGSSLSIYEALAAGLPTIVTPQTGSVVRDNVEGFIVPARDISKLKEKILFLYANQDVRSNMSAHAYGRAAEYTWENYGKKVVEFIRKIGDNL